MVEAIQDLKGKVAIITGGAGAVGSVTARRMAMGGARVGIADLPSSNVTQLADTLRQEGLDVAGHVLDLAQEASIKAVVDYTVRTFGRLDVLDNNAALKGLSEDRD